MKNIFLFLLSFFATALCFAQTEELTTDRPGAGNSPFIVPVKKFQIETGFLYDKEDEIKTFLEPTTLLRFALTNNFELRFNADVITEKEIKTEINNTGLAPVQFGFKANIIKAKNWIPELSLLSQFTLPKVASKNFKSAYLAPSFYLIMQNNLSEKLSFSYNLGTVWDGESAAPDYIYTASLNFDVSESIGSFFEIYGDKSQQSKAVHNIDAGLTYLVLHNLQLDVSGGIQLSKSDSQNYFLSGGICWRIPD